MTHQRVIVAAMVVVAFAGSMGARSHAQQPSSRLNRIIAQFEQGKTAFVQTDWAWIEMEQSPWNIVDLQNRLAKLKPGKAAPAVTPVLRIPPDADEPFRWFLKQALNMGLSSIVVPQIENKEQALKFVTAMRYPPQRGGKYPEPRGMRSYGPGRAASYWGLNQTEYVRRADVWPLNPEGELLAIMMIETKAGVDHIRDILGVPGVGAVLLGPFDLGMSLGVGPPVNGTIPPETEEAIQKVRTACLAVKKVICGIAGVDAKDRDRRVAEGFRMIQVIGGPPS